VARTIELPDPITVGQLAELLELPVSQLVAELFKNGVMATVNEKIDFDTAQIIIGDMDLDVELKKKVASSKSASHQKPEASDKAEPRPPVVAMMGHVDHGKTSLLDAIRGAKIAEGEAGGITQHLSAYQIKHNDRAITFLDTPGHEAFAALREHGAILTDLVVIVIAADDGIKPQTLEAIRFARQAGVKIIVAANKMDKANEVQLNQLKSQLAQEGLAPEGFGGDTIVVPVSAKTKDGVKELLDMVILVSDIEELKADRDGPAKGLVIEAHMEHGRGPVAEVLVEQGTLKAGQFVATGTTYGKVRTLTSTDGKQIKEALPSSPAIITGLKSLPDFGNEFETVGTEKIAKERAASTKEERAVDGTSNITSDSELLRVISRSKERQEFNIVIKADVQGSLTSVTDSLKTLDTDEVAVRVVGSAAGVINENDIHTAASAGAIIYGFNVDLPVQIKRLAARDKVPVRLYKVIYELIDDVKKEMESRLAPEIIEERLGELSVKGIFKITKTEVICGGEVIAGTLKVPALARVFRGKEQLADNLEVLSLKHGPQEVKEVPKGEMCGLSFKSEKRVEVVESDRIELFSRTTKTRSL